MLLNKKTKRVYQKISAAKIQADIFQTFGKAGVCHEIVKWVIGGLSHFENRSFKEEWNLPRSHWEEKPRQKLMTWTSVRVSFFFFFLPAAAGS